MVRQVEYGYIQRAEFEIRSSQEKSEW